MVIVARKSSPESRRNAEESQISYVDDRGDFILDDGCAINLRETDDWKLESRLSDDQAN